MKKDETDQISAALGIDYIPHKEVVPFDEKDLVRNESKDEDAEDDYQKSRETFHKLMHQGNSAIESLLDYVQQGGTPRAYEVLAGLIKTTSEVTKDLYDLQKKTRDLDPQTKKSDVINVDKAVFVGTSSDLLKQVKGKKNEDI